MFRGSFFRCGFTPMPVNTSRRSLLEATATRPNRRSVLKATAAGLTGTALASGSAAAHTLHTSYFANSTVYLHDTYDTSSNYDKRKKYTGMYTIDGPVDNDGYTWWKVKINGDNTYDPHRDKAWVAQKELDKSHFAYGAGCYFTSSHCEGRGHEGVDIGCGGGSSVEIEASQQGTVDVRWNWGCYGDSVVIYHDNDYKTLYAHLSEIDVVDGEHVDKYEHIGYTGNTGCSRGTHLHQELWHGPNGDYALEWPHDDENANGHDIGVWKRTGIPQEWWFLDC